MDRRNRLKGTPMNRRRRPSRRALRSQQLAVGHDIAGADIMAAALAFGMFQAVTEHGDGVGQGNRLDQRGRPARADDQRHPFQDRAEHAVGRTAQADDDPGPQRGHGHAVGAQRPLHFAAAQDVAGEVGLVGDHAAQVNDMADADPGRRPGKIIGADQVEVLEGPLGEVGRRQHGMDQVKRGVGAGQGLLAFKQRKKVAAAPGQAAVGGSRPISPAQADDPVVPGQFFGQSRADEAAGSGDGHGCFFAGCHDG